MSVETWLWIAIGGLAVRSVIQQIYICRLKLAMQNITEAMQRRNGLHEGDVLRGENRMEM